VAKRLRALAVALVSASTLAYEILLVRVFAIEEFHHFAYMAIGVAMLGLGAAGTFLALVLQRRTAAPGGPAFVWAALLTPIALIASPVLVHLIPLDVAQLAWDSAQWPRLASVYLLLALPFATGGLAVLLALTREPERTGVLYGAGFVGSGAGAALALVVLWLFLPTRALALPALIAAPGAVAAAFSTRVRSLRLASLLVLVVGLAVLVRPAWRLDITPYKALPQVEAYPQARRAVELSSPLGWVVAVEAAAFRHAPGLSLAYRGDFPQQTALFVDAQLAGATSEWGAADTALLAWLPTALPYALCDCERVLVIGAGGGLDVGVALHHGARRVEAVELDPHIVRLAARSASGTLPWERVEWVVADARSHVASTEAEFDLVTLGPAQGFGSSAAGLHALNEDFLHTVDAYTTYLERLASDGMLAITRWMTVPPRENVRVILTAVEALRRISPAAVETGIVVVRSWATATVLVKPAGFAAAEIDSLAAWARSRRFDLDWYPGIDAPHAEFNVLEEPTLFRAAAAAVRGGPASLSFADAYPFSVQALGDARPYPHHFLRLGSLRAFFRGGAGDWLPFAEWGFVALLATLAQSLALSLLLLIVPVAWLGGGSVPVGRTRLIAYFAAIGFAYLAAEIAVIQQLSLLLGHPVYAVAVVLAVFLIASGAGSAWSDRRPSAEVWRAGVGLAVLLGIYATVLLDAVRWLHPAPLAVRAGLAALVLVPLAFVMGTPFPQGLRDLCGGEGQGVAWAWASNGFASVVAAPLAALIALESGSRVLLLAAGLAYAAAAAAQRLGRGSVVGNQ